MIIVTSRKTTPAGVNHNGRTGTGFGNHSANKSNVLFAFDAVFDKLTEDKAVYKDRKEFKEQVMIPAFTKAGSKNPTGMANTIFPIILKEGKILEVKNS
jgi:hypothetical protein